MKVVGECFHMINGFLCTEGKHQNYPCPYGDKANQCSCFIPITREMVEQWEEHGCIHIPVKEVKGNDESLCTSREILR